MGSGCCTGPRRSPTACAGTQSVVVAGTHGKTTTTSMAAVALQHCGADPSFYIGAQLNETGTNAHAGTGTVFVAESDESDGSFLVLEPLIAVVTNVEADHLDYWGDGPAVRGRLPSVRRPGAAATASSSPAPTTPVPLAVADFARESGRRVVTYGAGAVGRRAHHRRRAGRHRFLVPAGGQGPPAARCLAADAWACTTCSTPRRRWRWRSRWASVSRDVVEGLAQYSGARRRFEFKGEADGVRVYDDYAHHHTELRATLTAARQIADGGRLVVAFQPLRFTRTAAVPPRAR